MYDVFPLATTVSRMDVVPTLLNMSSIDATGLNLWVYACGQLVNESFNLLFIPWC